MAIIDERLNDGYTSVDWAGYEERDLIIVHIGQDKTHRLSRIASCENKREFVLVGKDQTPKRRWDSFPSNEALYSLIDVMPMRRFEMRNKRENN